VPVGKEHLLYRHLLHYAGFVLEYRHLLHYAGFVLAARSADGAECRAEEAIENFFEILLKTPRLCSELQCRQHPENLSRTIEGQPAGEAGLLCFTKSCP
jgi:hypothetical protein